MHHWKAAARSILLTTVIVDTNNPGAVRWAAPERLSGCKPHPSGDMDSFGCMMSEVTFICFDIWAAVDPLHQVLSGDGSWREKITFQVVALKHTGRQVDRFAQQLEMSIGS